MGTEDHFTGSEADAGRWAAQDCDADAPDPAEYMDDIPARRGRESQSQLPPGVEAALARTRRSIERHGAGDPWGADSGGELPF